METYDVIIIGGGPAGLTTAIYTSRANLKTIFVERDAPGGKMVKTFTIENWSGDKEVSGPQLSMRMFEHAQSFGATYRYGDVQSVDPQPDGTLMVTFVDGTKLIGKTVVVATGMVERVPESIKNIRTFENRGVSYCAICDGPLHKNEPIAFIGGGNAAIDEALFTSQFASHVYVFVRKPEELIADKIGVARLKAKPNVTIYTAGEILELHGKDHVESALVRVDGETREMPIRAVFPYVGQMPVSSFVKHLGVTNPQGYIVTNESMETKVPHLYAIGDIRNKDIRQIATAVADGVIAAKHIATHL